MSTAMQSITTATIQRNESKRVFLRPHRARMRKTGAMRITHAAKLRHVATDAQLSLATSCGINMAASRQTKKNVVVQIRASQSIRVFQAGRSDWFSDLRKFLHTKKQKNGGEKNARKLIAS